MPAGNEFRFGIWADGRFSWMGPDWDIDLRYRDDTLVTQVTSNVALGLELRCQDAVDVNLNVYVRLVEVIDLEDRARDVRLFFGHDFRLYGNEVGDTAYFDPRTHCIVHYKINRYFLVGCCGPDGTVADAFSCGVRATRRERAVVEGRGGWGAHREPDRLGLRGVHRRGSSPSPSRWTGGRIVLAGRRHALRGGGAAQPDRGREDPGGLIERTADYWRAWVAKESRAFTDLPRRRHQRLQPKPPRFSEPRSTTGAPSLRQTTRT